MRDDRIETAYEEITQVRDSHNWLIRSLIISVCGSGLIAFILWAFQNFKG
jgi:hypothetical protein